MYHWADLPPDLVALVAQKIDYLDDFFRFGAVCRSWRSVTVDTDKFQLSKKSFFPWLMLPQTDENDDRRCFVSPLEKRVRHITLPELHGCRCWGSSYGWLVSLNPSNGQLSLLNPLTRETMHFPSLTTEDCLNICKAVLSLSYSEDDEDGRPVFKVSVTMRNSRLKFATFGDAAWIRRGNYPNVEDFVDQNGEICMVDWRGHLSYYDGFLIRTRKVASSRCYFNKETQYMVYLFELHGSLHVALKNLRYNNCGDNCKTFFFQVYSLRFFWDRVDTLGNYALFLGDNASFALNADDYPGCKPGCIYFTDDRERKFGRMARPDMGVFNLKDQKFEEPFYNGSEVVSKFSPSIWIKPSLSK